MRKGFLLCLLLIGLLETTCEVKNLPGKRGKIHALIVGDTDDYRIGDSVEVDVESMTASLAAVASGINFTLRIFHIFLPKDHRFYAFSSTQISFFRMAINVL
jgi:hypothetical protein